MGIEYKINFDIGKWKSDLRARAEKAVATQMEQAARQIVERTQSGTDADGNPFRRYSKSYAAMKAATGRDSGTVDLTYTGRMLKAVHTKIQKSMNFIEGVIYVTPGQAEKARKHMEGDPGTRLPKRPFLKLSAQQIRSLVDAIKKVKLIG